MRLLNDDTPGENDGERESLPPVMLFTTVVEYKLNWRKGGNYYDAERGVGGGNILGK